MTTTPLNTQARLRRRAEAAERELRGWREVARLSADIHLRALERIARLQAQTPRDPPPPVRPAGERLH